jgi:hypothetical protein
MNFKELASLRREDCVLRNVADANTLRTARVPESGCSIPAMILSRVVFPDPFGWATAAERNRIHVAA